MNKRCASLRLFGLALIAAASFFYLFRGAVASFLGVGISTRNAYEALDQPEWAAGRGTSQNSLSIAELQLQAEEIGITFPHGPRIHAPGTLMKLRYSTLDSTKKVLDAWDVHAIVPELGTGQPDAAIWSAHVPDIEAALKPKGGIILRDSGKTGVPIEILLRMVVGRPLEIPMPAELITRDLFSLATHKIRRGVSQQFGTIEAAPETVRIELLETCEPKLQFATVKKIDFGGTSFGLDTKRWIQMIGCVGTRQ